MKEPESIAHRQAIAILKLALHLMAASYIECAKSEASMEWADLIDEQWVMRPDPTIEVLKEFVNDYIKEAADELDGKEPRTFSYRDVLDTVLKELKREERI